MTMRCGKCAAIICHCRSRVDTAPWQSQRGVKKEKKKQCSQSKKEYIILGVEGFGKNRKWSFLKFESILGREPLAVYCAYSLCAFGRCVLFPFLSSSSSYSMSCLASFSTSFTNTVTSSSSSSILRPIPSVNWQGKLIPAWGGNEPCWADVGWPATYIGNIKKIMGEDPRNVSTFCFKLENTHETHKNNMRKQCCVKNKQTRETF